MKKILHVYPQLNCGGTEMVFYNLIKFADRTKLHFEILAQKPGTDETVFRELGTTIRYIPFVDDSSYLNALTKLMKEQNYDVVHAHMHSQMGIVLKAAKNAGIICRVAHSHNARIDLPRSLWPLLAIRHLKLSRDANQFFGCSELALKWLFPFSWKKGHVIHNGIDIPKFYFDEESRNRIRLENGVLPSTKLILNVGRCSEQKNHKFILELAEAKKGSDYLFVIIGEGPLLKDLTEYKERHKLENVILKGRRDDVNQWMSAADLFLFPSLYEGLGIVAIEAQASGLDVLAAEKIPQEADIGFGTFHTLKLADKESWLKMIEMPRRSNSERLELSKRAVDSAYNILNVEKDIEKYYGF